MESVKELIENTEKCSLGASQSRKAIAEAVVNCYERQEVIPLLLQRPSADYAVACKLTVGGVSRLHCYTSGRNPFCQIGDNPLNLLLVCK